jgi:formylglycine-generating enzyme required for sulfatase activity
MLARLPSRSDPPIYPHEFLKTLKSLQLDRRQIEGMALVPAGDFTMGSEESPNESPMRTVHLSAYYIDRFPVTNAQYRLFVNGGGYAEQRFWSEAGWEFIRQRNLQHPLYWGDDHWNKGDQPVTGISWFEAVAYARFAGKSLPTEAQWECAAHGRDARRYPWGNEEPRAELAHYARDCDPAELRRRSLPVTACAAGASPFGCIDMAGNLAEWCLDNASSGYQWDLTCANPLYWTGEQDDHIARGGSALHNEDHLRCSSRDYYPPSVRDNITIKRSWSGVLLRDVLEASGINTRTLPAPHLHQISVGTPEKGRYESWINLQDALSRDALLVHSVDGAPLPPAQGFPLRLIDFGLYGYKNVKGLTGLSLTNELRLGYWEELAGYSLDGTVKPKRYWAVDRRQHLYAADHGEVVQW